MGRSSIFSFDTLAESPRLTRAGWLALGLFLVVRILLEIRPVHVLNYSEDDGYTAFTERELRVRLGGQVHPKVVVLGTSRLDTAPFTGMPAKLGIERNDFINLSQAGNTFWLNAAFLRRNPDLLRDARVVIMDLLPYQLRHHVWIFPEDDEMFLRFSTLGERLRVLDPGKRFAALTDWVLLTGAEPRQPIGWRRGLGYSFDSPEKYEEMLRQRVSNAQMEARRQGERREIEELKLYLSTLYFPGTPVAVNQLAALNNLAGLVPEDCRIIFVMFPISEQLLGYFLADEARSAAFIEFKELVGQMERPNVSVLWELEPASEAFDADDYLDGIHFTASGYEKAEEALVEAVRKEFPKGL